jgi:hypothetical protein
MTYREFDVAAVIALALLFMLPCGPLEADGPRYQGARVARGDDVTLAATCVGESGMSRDACAAEIGVLARTAARRGISVGAQAHAYSAIWRTESRPWLLELNARGTRPPSWPRASWTRYRGEWVAMLEHVRAVLAGEVEDPCPAAAHFGGPMDARRMHPDQWERVCADRLDTRQMFWRARP